MPRRWVDVSEAVYLTIEHLFPAERTDSKPSWADFLAADLTEIVERFATDWDTLPAAGELPEFRMLWTRGRVVAFTSVVGMLRPDGSISLVSISVDFEGLPEPDDE